MADKIRLEPFCAVVLAISRRRPTDNIDRVKPETADDKLIDWLAQSRFAEFQQNFPESKNRTLN
jgi:hypothetical protein